MSRRRRRPHPARRARRVAGAGALGAYAGLLVAVGWSQRAADSGDAAATTAATNAATTAATMAANGVGSEGVARLDLGRSAEVTIWTPSTTLARPTVAPTPPPPPSLAATTTTIPALSPPSTAPTASPATAPPTTATPATSPPTVPPTSSPTSTTTTVFVPPTSPPPSSIPTGGS